MYTHTLPLVVWINSRATGLAGLPAEQSQSSLRSLETSDWRTLSTAYIYLNMPPCCHSCCTAMRCLVAWPWSAVARYMSVRQCVPPTC